MITFNRTERANSAWGRAAREIIRKIEREGLAAGDRLPTSMQLSGELQYNADTIQRAMRELEAIGIIDIRNGRNLHGYYVAVKRR